LPPPLPPRRCRRCRRAAGEHVLGAAGEVHLETCIKDLTERFAKIQLQVRRLLAGACSSLGRARPRGMAAGLACARALACPACARQAREGPGPLGQAQAHRAPARAAQVSAPLVAFRETVQRAAEAPEGASAKPGRVMEATTPSGFCTVRVRATALPAGVASAIDDSADLLRSRAQGSHGAPEAGGGADGAGGAAQGWLADARLWRGCTCAPPAMTCLEAKGRGLAARWGLLCFFAGAGGPAAGSAGRGARREQVGCCCRRCGCSQAEAAGGVRGGGRQGALPAQQGVAARPQAGRAQPAAGRGRQHRGSVRGGLEALATLAAAARVQVCWARKGWDRREEPCTIGCSRQLGSTPTPAFTPPRSLL
jgi:hypothetical protein